MILAPPVNLVLPDNIDGHVIDPVLNLGYAGAGGDVAAGFGNPDTTVEKPTAPWLAGGETMRKFYDEGKVDGVKAEVNVPADGPTAEMAKKGKAFSAERAKKALEAKKKADAAKAAKAAAAEKSGNPVGDTPGESKKTDQ